jgi:hypothetical protein
MAKSSLRTVAFAPQWSGEQPQDQLIWPQALSGDSEDFYLDVSVWLADCGPAGDTIQTVSVATVLGGLTIAAPAFVGGLLSVNLGGGTPNTTYGVNFTVTTAGNRTKVFSVLLAVGTDPSLAAASPFTIQGMPAGTVISWGSGATGMQMTQRSSDGKFVISTTAGVPLMSIDSLGNMTCAGGMTTNATP